MLNFSFILSGLIKFLFFLYMKKKRLILYIVLFSVLSVFGQRQMENLGRGVVAVRTATNSAFISWRLLGTESWKTGFNLYKSVAGGAEVKLNSTVLYAGTNFTDNSLNSASDNSYFVKPIVNGVEQESSASCTLKANTAIEPCLVVPIKEGKRIHFVWVGDLDGDGEFDYVVDRIDFSNGGVKIEAYKRDGTYLWTMDMGPNSKNMDNISPGSSCLDVGMWDGLTVYDMDGDGKAEVFVRSANGVIFGDGATLTNSDNNVQFISVLNGMTGAEISRLQIPTDFLSIGPMACQLGIGYLNGKSPGLYAFFRNRDSNDAFHDLTCAYEFVGKTLELKWKKKGSGGAYGHQMRILDFNGDGIDDFGSLGGVLNGKDGSILYSISQTDNIGHGDRWHVGKLDPNRPGLQGYGVQQDNQYGILEYYYDATTGEVLWKHTTLNAGDIGRGTAADTDPRYPGYEVWSFFGQYNGPTNKKISTNTAYPNLRLWWDSDLLGDSYNDGKIEKWNYTTSAVDRLVNTWSYETATGSDRGAPMFYGDILGDWREEVILTNSDYSKLIIFTSTVATNHRIYTLAHNPEYRNCMTVKGYMQSHMVDYYLGADMSTPPTPPIQTAKCIWKGNALNNVWDPNVTQNWMLNNTEGAFNQGDDVMFDISGNPDTTVFLVGNLMPSSIKVISPLNYSFNGAGTISGNTGLLKSGYGALTFNNALTYTDTTRIEQGAVYVNDTLFNSPVLVYKEAQLGGKGEIKQPVKLMPGSYISPGDKGKTGTITFAKDLTIRSGLIANYHITNDSTGTIKPSDQIKVRGNLIISDTMTIVINKVNGIVKPGTYPLISYSGTFSGNLKKIGISGLFGQKYILTNSEGVISLTIEAARNAANIVWNGTSKIWDLQTTAGWNLDENPVTFVANDSVLLDSMGTNNPTITVVGTLPVKKITVNTTTNNYTLSGTGNIGGTGGLTKNGLGTLALLNTNSFTGKTIINGGILEVANLAEAGANSSLGANPSTAPSELQLTNSTLKYSGTATNITDKGMTMNGTNDTINVKWLSGSLTIQGLITGKAGLVKTGAGTLNLQKNSNTFSGNTVIKAGKLSLGDESANLKGLNSGSITFDSGTLTMYSSTSSYTEFLNNFIVPAKGIGTLNTDARCNYRGTLTGEGTFNINLVGTIDRTVFFGNWSAFSGTINITGVSGARFRIANSFGYENAIINLNDNISLYHGGTGTNAGDGIATTVKIGALTGTSLSRIFEENWIIGAKNTDCRFNGVIAGNSLTKVGTGTLTLSGNNTYTGGTTITNGVLMVVNTAGSGTGTTTVNVSGSGTLAGNGIIAGPVNVSNGGALSPGVNAIGKLTINNNLTMASGSNTLIEAKRNPNLNDVVSSSGAITYGGTLNINNTGTTAFANGDSLIIFNAVRYNGSFSNIVPATPGDGLVWDLSDLNTSGILKVALVQSIKNISDLGITMAPNPVNDRLWISLKEVDVDAEISIYSVSGTILYKNKFDNIQLEIPVSNFKPGIYVVKIKTTNNAAVSSFIKK